ncbi:MAG: hypothetical protein FD125_722 [bacterium]|nr:MAG: hypothetical protein FD125_722 [bacterium]
MSQSPSLLDQLKQGARRFAAGVRPGHLAIVAVVAVAGVGISMARTMSLPGPQPILDGEQMKIQVVAPVEPEITPGSVMEVGDLVEGFEYRRPTPAVIEADDYAPWDEESEVPTPRPASRRNDDYAMAPAPPPDTRVDQRDTRADRWFGFDAPDRDYRAEREARRARMDARIEQERERREVRWYRPDGEPVADRERETDPGAPRG